MLTIHDSGTKLCDGLTRREWLRAGSLGMLGLSLPQLLSGRAGAAGAPVRAKSCILLYFSGGPSQFDTWDPKPLAPAEVKGPYQPIATNVPGIQVSELMPKTAKLLDKCCVLRAVSTDDNAHSSSTYYMLTGRPHQPVNVENALPAKPNDWPCVAAMVKCLRPGNGALPPAVVLPDHLSNVGNIIRPGQDAGFLGRNADPWLIHCDPSAPDFQVPGLGLPAEMSPLRLDGRRSLLEQVDRHFDQADQSGALSRFDQHSQQAFGLVQGGAARRAFDLNQERQQVRQRYGQYRFGQSALLARRLVEAGVPLVQVNWTKTKGVAEGWDTHQKHNQLVKEVLMPLMDQTYSALLEDLAERGLLEQTLVVWMGEFGRTPKFNAAGGRDHWGHVFSLALAGGGVRGGQVIGSSDSRGAYPKDRRVRPPELTATIFHCLGIAPNSEVRDPLGRPLAVTTGDVIREAF